MAGPGGVLVGRGYVVIRPEFAGDWDRRVHGQSSRSGALGGRAFGAAFARDARAGMAALWKGTKWSAIGAGAAGAVAGIAQIGPAALAASAVAVPALSTIGTAGAAIGVGLKGVGKAFKAFDSAAADAKAAASATRQVESAQRALARAQAGVGEAQAAAARRVRDAQKGLLGAQRDAIDVQRELNGAYRDARRALEDYKLQLAEASIDQEEAALRAAEAEAELAEARASGDQDAIKRAELAARRANLSVEQQARDYKRLKEDSDRATAAGVEGSEQVVSAKERISEANARVADAEQDLKDAQVDGAKQVKDAQEAVADAARALADAQSAAASQVSKVDEAMAKLTPNARNFVETVKELGPAWGEVRKATQESLFRGLGDSFRDMSKDTIPVLRDGLSGAADQVNLMVRNWMGGVRRMAQDGTLRRFFDGNNKILQNFSKWPEEATRGWVQLSVAAQPALDKLTLKVAAASTRLSDRLTESFESGRLEKKISGAFDELKVLKEPLRDIGTIFKNLFDSMIGPGGEVLGFIGEFLDELARITSLPKVKEALQGIFQAMADITESVMKGLTPLIEHGLPVLADGLGWVADILPRATGALRDFAGVVIDWIGPKIRSVADNTRLFLGAFQTGDAAGIDGQASALERFGAATRTFTTESAANFRSFIDGFQQNDRKPVWFESSSNLTDSMNRAGVAARSFATIYKDELLVALDAGRGVWSGLQPVLESAGRILAGMAQQGFERIATIIQRVFLPVIRAVGDVVRDHVSPALEQLGGKLSTMLDRAAPVISFLDTLFTFVVKVGSAVLGTLIPPLIRLAGPVLGFLFDVLGGLVTSLGYVFLALSKVGDATEWLWRRMQPVFEIVGVAARILGAVIFTVLVAPVVIGFEILSTAAWALWDYALSPVFGLVTQGADLLWRYAIGPMVTLISGGLKKIGDDAMFLWRNVIEPVASGIGGAITGLWTNTLSPKFTAIVDGLKDIGTWAQNTYNTVAEWFGKIGTKVGEVTGGIGTAFANAKQAVKDVWEGVDGIAEIAARPVRFIVDKVYGAVRSVWNFVIGAVGLDSLKLPEYKLNFAGGGVVPGYAPGVDSVNARLSPGEGVLVPEAVRWLGPKWVYDTNARFARGRKPGAPQQFAYGGIAGHPSKGMPAGGLNPFDPRDWDDYASKGIDWAQKGLGAAYEGLKQVPGVGDVIQWAEKLVRGAAAEAAERLLRPVANWAGSGIADAMGQGVNREAAYGKALRGAPGSWVDKLVARIRSDDAEQQEAWGGGAWLKPADGSYGAGFGQAGPLWASGKHTGLDILAPFGSDVRAVAAGSVVDRSTAGPYGNHLLLNHAGGIQSLYAHLNEMLVGFGDLVTAGQRIGTVGMTGNTTGPHLHLEARSLTRGGFDPLEMLNSAVSGKAAPPGQVRDWIVQGLSIVGQGGNQAWINGLYTIAMRESGGNPRAINLWDSNAAKGTPSKGLLQFIDPTFNAHALAPYTDIWNPIHQVVADWFYIRSRYGDISKVQQANPSKPPKGYAWGGIVDKPRGTHDAGGWLEHGRAAVNLSGVPEAVLTGPDYSLMRAAAVANNRGNGIGEIRVYVGDREITDIVRTEIRDHDGALVDALDGRG